MLAAGCRAAGGSAASFSAAAAPAVCSLSALLGHLSLERLEEDLFRGESIDPGWGRVFGGQVLAQALSAAESTTEPGRDAHSLHSYFLRPGDVTRPIIYDVERIRDGASFSARRVKAVQNGKPIFFMTASFHVSEAGQYEHQDVGCQTFLTRALPACLGSHGRPPSRPRKGPVAIRGDVWTELSHRAASCHGVQSPTDPQEREPLNALWIRAKDGKLPEMDSSETESNVHRASEVTPVTTGSWKLHSNRTQCPSGAGRCRLQQWTQHVVPPQVSLDDGSCTGSIRQCPLLVRILQWTSFGQERQACGQHLAAKFNAKLKKKKLYI